MSVWTRNCVGNKLDAQSIWSGEHFMQSAQALYLVYTKTVLPGPFPAAFHLAPAGPSHLSFVKQAPILFR